MDYEILSLEFSKTQCLNQQNPGQNRTIFGFKVKKTRHRSQQFGPTYRHLGPVYISRIQMSAKGQPSFFMACQLKRSHYAAITKGLSVLDYMGEYE